MDTTDTTELLAGLKGIHLPPAPETPSVWPVVLSLAICACAVVFFIARYYKNQNKNSWHRSALLTLNNLQQQTPADALHQAASLLKRIVLTEQNTNTTKHLNGQRWLQYLDRFFNTNYFSSGDGRIFGDSLYQSGSTLTDSNYSELKKLIKRHRWRQ